MTDEEILEMVQQVWPGKVIETPTLRSDIIAFARLVAEKQKEADARICEEAGPNEYPLRLVSDGFAAAIRSQK